MVVRCGAQQDMNRSEVANKQAANKQVADANTSNTFAEQSLQCLNEFAGSAWSSGVTEKINGVRQLCGSQIPQHENQPELHGVMKLSHIAGQTAGEIAFFLAASKVVGKGIKGAATRGAALEAGESVFAKSVVGQRVASASSLLSRSHLAAELVTAGATGALAGGVFKPVGNGESQWQRVGNAATDCATFMTLGGVAGKYGGAFAENFAGRMKLNALSGGVAGMVNTNMDALTHGRVASVGDTLMGGAGFAVGNVVTAEAFHGLGKAWQRVSEIKALDIQLKPDVLERANAITGEIDRIQSLTEDSAPGMTREEFYWRARTSCLGDEPLRVTSLGSTLGWFIGEDLIANRAVGAVGKVRGYIPGHGDLHWVEHTDGSFAPYNVQAELEPAILKPSFAVDAGLKIESTGKPIADLQIGDVVKVGRSETGDPVKGLQADWQESDAGIRGEREDGNIAWIPFAELKAGNKVTLLGKDGLPSGNSALEAQVGDKLDCSGWNGWDGVYKVKEREFAPPEDVLFREFRVSNVADGQVLLSQPDYWNQKTNEYTVPIESLREPLFRKFRDFSVEPGDQVVAPINSEPPNSYDWLFNANVRGHRWTVSQAQPNGVILSNDLGHFLVPHEYFNTRTLFPSAEWQARTGG